MRGREHAQNNYTFYLHPLFLFGLENSTGTITLQRSKYCSLRHIKVTVNFLKLNNKFLDLILKPFQLPHKLKIHIRAPN